MQYNTTFIMTFAAMSGLCSTVTSGMLRNMDVYLAGM